MKSIIDDFIWNDRDATSSDMHFALLIYDAAQSRCVSGDIVCSHQLLGFYQIYAHCLECTWDIKR